jgi:hypothetical protein
MAKTFAKCVFNAIDHTCIHTYGNVHACIPLVCPSQEQKWTNAIKAIHISIHIYSTSMHWAKNMRMMARFRFRSSVLILDRDSRLFIWIFVSFPVYTAIPCTYVHTYISWKPQIHVDGKFLQLSLSYCTQHLVAYIQTNIHKYRKVTLHTITRCWRKLRRKLSYPYTAIPYSKYIHTYIHTLRGYHIPSRYWRTWSYAESDYLRTGKWALSRCPTSKCRQMCECFYSAAGLPRTLWTDSDQVS